MDFNDLFINMINYKYYTYRQITYDTNVGILMNQHEYQRFLQFKRELLEKGVEPLKKINLLSFNNSPLFFALSKDLIDIENQYFDLIINDIETNNKNLFTRNINDITQSRIYSEVEGTLNIENVPTTRKAVVELAANKRQPQNLNDQIIKNMINGIIFVNSLPDFNSSNLFKLYNILSQGCLEDNCRLKEGFIYRDDEVEVDNYQGCPKELIKPCMDSLFSFINSSHDSYMKFLLPHIAHYYIAYVHPYFDYNGRTARMVSYWISLLTNKGSIPPIVSEAINQTKSEYYGALRETRNSNNDLTYFLNYIFNVSVKYFLTYKNIEEIDQNLKNRGIVLSNNERVYFKKILISNRGKFLHQDFCNWIDINMTKQGALKILNILETYGLLKSETTASNKKLFEVNDAVIKYRFRG